MTDKFHSISEAYQTYLRDDQAEQNHWEDVCRSYRQYATFAMAQWASVQYRLHSLPESQRQYLPEALKRDTEDFQERVQAYKDAAIRNQFCLDCILRHAGQPHSQEALNQHTTFSNATQMSKVSSVLKSLMRDWSTEGKVERDMSYKPIMELLQKYVPIEAGKEPKVSVPGAGVGRLACEITTLGYAVQGNEFSLYMLLASDFILNGAVATPDRPLKISPFLLETRDVHNSDDPTRVFTIPDQASYDMLNERREGGTKCADFSMAAGDFVSIYNVPGEKNEWDAVVSCFFLDVSPSVIEYLQVIHHMLKPGGILVNFGPLHWHWSGPSMSPEDKSFEQYCHQYSHLDKRYLLSVDLCWEDVRTIMTNIGFEILEEETNVPALYTADTRSMIHTKYQCIKFVAKKVDPPAKSEAKKSTAEESEEVEKAEDEQTGDEQMDNVSQSNDTMDGNEESEHAAEAGKTVIPDDSGSASGKST